MIIMWHLKNLEPLLLKNFNFNFVILIYKNKKNILIDILFDNFVRPRVYNQTTTPHKFFYKFGKHQSYSDSEMPTPRRGRISSTIKVSYRNIKRNISDCYYTCSFFTALIK